MNLDNQKPAMPGTIGHIIAAAVALSGTIYPAIGADTFSEARGVVIPRHKVVVQTDIVAKVSKLPKREGEAFEKGQLLIEFDCSRYHAELKSAQSRVNAASQNLKAKKSLLKYKAAGSSEVKIAAAELGSVAGEKQALDTRVADCVFNAPFSGRVSELAIHEFELPSPNQPLMKIISDRDLEVDLVVPSTWLSWLAVDMPFRFKVDETGRIEAARISRLGAEVDPVSRTIRVKGIFEKIGPALLSGMSGTAQFSTPDV